LTPITSNGLERALRDGGSDQKLSDLESLAWVNALTPDFFLTYGTPVLAGRDLDHRDRRGAPPVAIVNDAFARRFGGGGNVLGRVLVREG
jgi:hypothetical protein